MKRRIVKIISTCLCASILFSCVQLPAVSAEKSGYTAHSIAAGESREGNPLKGMVPFDFSTTSFPHSMEWFYIPVSDVQTGMNEFNWSKLEKRLNAIASRGHQAVMRFYYDYPGEGSGVPQFLIDQGLEMKYYNEPDDLGGSGYCPDYENPVFRQSMINFIKAFGQNYDGDGRLAYITMGLLGFWGEWHNWPYDEDKSDGRADWSISTEVYREVLDAFDSSFNITQLCVREPKSGINYANYDIGFHDDSFGYATLTQKNGGQDWSFMQKMVNFNLQNRWQTNCIGGEIYPPSQNSIFSGVRPDGSFQDWDLCMQEAHATWMLCEAMKHYSGTSLANAKKAAKQMGYDFRVTTAYYDDAKVTEPLYLKVDIKNIGVAPFYYDHRVWPVQIGIKQDGRVVKTWRTEWDLCDIPADATEHSFEYMIQNHGLSVGDYTIGIKVINPIQNGNILGFANQGQGSDGWLNLGNIRIVQDKENETTEPETTTAPEQETKPSGDVDINKAWADNNYIYCNFRTNVDYSNWQMYIDTDSNRNSGYLLDTDSQHGFEYMLENGMMYYHSENSNSWKWDSVENAAVEVEYVANGINVKISKNSFGNLDKNAKIRFKLIDSAWNAIALSEVFVVQEINKDGVVISDDIEINGYQISANSKGLGIVYSVDSLVEEKNVSEVGLIYGIDIPEYNPKDMVAESKNPAVYMSKGTKEKGKFDKAISKSSSYVMTMRFVSGIQEEYNTVYYVRAYAKLSDGTYAYTDIENYTAYEVADYLYQNKKMSKESYHNYLFEDILTVVKSDYSSVKY